MDSFIDQDMEDGMVEDASAPGSAVKKSKGLKSRALSASAGARPQPPIQPGATLTGSPPNPLRLGKKLSTASLACMFTFLFHFAVCRLFFIALCLFSTP